MAEYISNGITGDYIIYKDKPLVRKDNLYCYGDMSDKYVLFLMALTTKKTEDGKEIPDHILAQIIRPEKIPVGKARKAVRKERALRCNRHRAYLARKAEPKEIKWENS